MVNYGFIKDVKLNIEDAEQLVKIELEKEGFGVLTKIDVREKF